MAGRHYMFEDKLKRASRMVQEAQNLHAGGGYLEAQKRFAQAVELNPADYVAAVRFPAPVFPACLVFAAA